MRNLEFIRDRIIFQYNEEELEFFNNKLTEALQDNPKVKKGLKHRHNNRGAIREHPKPRQEAQGGGGNRRRRGEQKVKHADELGYHFAIGQQ